MGHRLNRIPRPTAIKAPRLTTLDEAVDWLREQGMRTNKAALSRANQDGRLVKRNGAYDPEQLMAMVTLNLPVRGRGDPDDPEKAEVVSWHKRKLAAQVEEIEAKAQRQKIAAARERGALVDRKEVLKDMAARAAQLRGDFEAWAQEVPLRIIDKYNLGADAVGDLRSLIMAAGKEWFDRYTKPLEFEQEIGDDLDRGEEEGAEG